MIESYLAMALSYRDQHNQAWITCVFTSSR